MFDSSLAHTAHWTAISFLSYGFELSVLELYLFFSSCFASSCLTFRTCLFAFFCLLAKKFLSNISLYFPDVSAKRLSFFSLSFAFAFRCFRPYKNHPSIQWVQYNHRNTMALLLIDCSLSRLPIDPSACHHALLISSFQFCFQNSHNCGWYLSHICRDVLQALLNAFCQVPEVCSDVALWQQEYLENQLVPNFSFKNSYAPIGDMKSSSSPHWNYFIFMNLSTDGDECGIIRGNLNLLFSLLRMFIRITCWSRCSQTFGVIQSVGIKWAKLANRKAVSKC